MATCHCSAAPPASNIYDEFEELHRKADLGVISESAVHEELEVLHSMHGSILRMEDYQEESLQPRQLNLQKVTVAQSSNICFGDLLDDSDVDVTLAHDGSCEAPSLVIPSSETPLYDALLDKLCHTGDEDVMERLAELCIFDKLIHITLRQC